MATDSLKELYPTIQTAIDDANEELKGFLPATQIDGRMSGAAFGEQIKLFNISVSDPTDYEEKMTVDTASDRTETEKFVKLEHRKKVSFNIYGEEELALSHNGVASVATQRAFRDATRKVNDAIELSIAETLLKNASRAYGDISKVPFGTPSDMIDFAQIARIFDENGTPYMDRQFVLNSASMANIRAKMSNLFKVNEAGDDGLLRTGLLNSQLEGFNIYQSGALKQHKKGTAVNYVLGVAPSAGATTITLGSAASGTAGTGGVLAGDIITIEGDIDNKYVVNTGNTTAGDIAIGAPGLMKDYAKDKAVTLLSDFTPNIAFQRDTVLLGMRTPAMPANGDGAIARDYFQSIYGIPYMVSIYPGHGMNVVEISTVWGVAVENSANVAVLF